LLPKLALVVRRAKRRECPIVVLNNTKPRETNQ